MLTEACYCFCFLAPVCFVLMHWYYIQNKKKQQTIICKNYDLKQKCKAKQNSEGFGLSPYSFKYNSQKWKLSLTQWWVKKGYFMCFTGSTIYCKSHMMSAFICLSRHISFNPPMLLQSCSVVSSSLAFTCGTSCPFMTPCNWSSGKKTNQ